MAGSTAAGVLGAAGVEVSLFDKGARPGGRMSSRTIGDISFDHGAQYITAKTEAFTETLVAWSRSGVVKPWEARFMDWADGRMTASHNHPRWVGVPAMAYVLAYLQYGLDVQYGQAVTEIVRGDSQWSVRLGDGNQHDGFSHLIIAIPPEQAAPLLKDADSALEDEVAGVRSRPCWTLLLCFDHPLELDFDAVRFTRHECLGWLANNSTKPGRPADGPECWVVQATDRWSHQHLEQSKEEIAAAMLDELRQLVSAYLPELPQPVTCKAHRWRYAHADGPVGTENFVAQQQALVVCGDWLLGSRVENAYLSGAAAADAVLALCE